MEESEHDNSEQEDSDDQPRQSEVIPKRGATSIAWFGFEKSDTDQKNVKYAANRSPHQTQTPPTYFTTYERITTNSTERVYG